MEERILEFIGDLRRAEIRISPSEALDALAASAEVGLTDRETFKADAGRHAGQGARDEPTFDRIFNLYFLDLEALGEGLKKALGPEDPRVQDLLDQVMAEENLDLDELTELLHARAGQRDGDGHPRRRPERRPRAADVLPAGRISSARRISDQFDWSAIERDIERIMQALEARGLDPGQLARIRNYLELRLEAFRRMIRQHVQRELERRAYRAGREAHARGPRRQAAVRADARRGRPDAQRRGAAGPQDQGRAGPAAAAGAEGTHRLAARPCARAWPYGGVPMEIFLKRRHREKPKLITICDVSDSVRNASRFMLQLVWSLQECFSRVRSYVFVSEIAEVTPGLLDLSGRAGHRVGAQGRAGRLPLPLGLRLRVQPVHHDRAGVARPQDDDPAARATRATTTTIPRRGRFGSSASG